MGYIVSKGYLVRSMEDYVAKDEVETMYEVCFPYTDFEDWQRTGAPSLLLPRKNRSGNWEEIVRIPSIYTTYEEAKLEAEEKNKSLLRKTLAESCPTVEIYKKEKETITAIWKENTTECEAFENWITKNTEELEITKPTEEMLLLSCHLKRDKSKEN